MDADTRQQVERRLGRIAGQVAGIQRMVQEGRYCVDVLLQVAAVQAALGQVGKLVLGSHVDTCVTEAMASGSSGQRRQKLEELMAVFDRFAQLRGR